MGIHGDERERDFAFRSVVSLGTSLQGNPAVTRWIKSLLPPRRGSFREKKVIDCVGFAGSSIYMEPFA